MELSDYIKSERREFKRLKENLEFLESINLPLSIEKSDNIFRIYSEDYSLATDFEIKRRFESLGGFSCYDGGYHTTRYDFCPQFYFILKNKSNDVQVLVQHKGFKQDNQIIIKSCSITKGYKDYSDKNNYIDHNIDTKKVLSFFKKEGVKESLLDKLQEKIYEISTFYAL